MDSDRPEFIVYAPAYNDSVGGVIVLHLLCHRLNQLKFKAALWPWGKPTYRHIPREWSSIRSHLGYYLKLRWRNYPRGPFCCPLVVDPRHTEQAVVIYPEIVSGNPLGAPKVARWFLHRPGYHTSHINYGDGEIYFFFDEAFNDKAINSDADNLLRLTYINPIFQRTNFGARSGSCYLIRKGKLRSLNKHPPDAILIDNLSDKEKAAVFNQVECLYSYDPYTLYVRYAAICGCIPVIIPEDGVSKEEWRPNPRRRLGVAYGAAEIPLARQQQDDLVKQLKMATAEEDLMLHRFVQKCRSHFGGSA
jgi:hypothetical protein